MRRALTHERPIGFLQFVEQLGVRLTDGQRVLCAVAFDGKNPNELPPAEREIAATLFGAVETIPDAARAVAVWVCGARAGKTYTCSLRALHLALVTRLHTLAPGEAGFAVIVAPDLRLARQAHRYMCGAIDGTPALAKLVERRTNESIVLRRTDGRIVELLCLPASEAGKSLRGRTLACCIFDEVAFFYTSEAYTVTDADLFKAVAPRIVEDGQILLASTPWGEQGLLYEFWRSDFGRPQSAIVAHAPTLALRDDAHTTAIVEREMVRDPDNARREHGAEFAGSASSLLEAELVDRAVDPGRYENPRNPSYKYSCCIDLSSKADFSVVLIGHREMMSRPSAPPVDVIVVDYAQHWEPQRDGIIVRTVSAVKGVRESRMLDAGELEVQIANLATAYRTNGVVGDSWGFSSMHARLKSRGIEMREAPMHNSEQTRRAQLLLTYFRQNRIRLPDGNPEFLRQLKQAVVRRLPGGLLRFEAPQRKGYHDDYLACLCLLCDELQALEATGGNVRSRWVNGTCAWFEVDENGDEWPTLAPIGSIQWLELANQALTRGVYVTGMMEWLENPANREAAERHREREVNARLALGHIRRLRMV